MYLLVRAAVADFKMKNGQQPKNEKQSNYG